MDGESPHSYGEADYDWAPLTSEAEPILAGVAVAAGDDALAGLGLFDPKITGLMRANAKEYARNRAAELVGKKYVGGKLAHNPGWSIPQATRDEIQALTTEAVSEGWATDRLAAALRDAAAFSRDRAQTVARTEVAMADTQGSIEGWRASGQVSAKEWLTAPDCCDECLDLDGEVVGIDEQFEDGDPPLHPNCRCCLLPVLSDDEVEPDNGDE